MKKISRKETDYSKEQNRIAKGSTIVGDIESQGSFRIEGVLKGSLKTPGKVVLGESGYIEGNIECTDADIEGKFEGNITVKNNLNLKKTSLIDGDVITGRLSVEPGASLNGACTMSETVKNLNENDGKKSKRSKQSQKTA